MNSRVAASCSDTSSLIFFASSIALSSFRVAFVILIGVVPTIGWGAPCLEDALSIPELERLHMHIDFGRKLRQCVMLLTHVHIISHLRTLSSGDGEMCLPVTRFHTSEYVFNHCCYAPLFSSEVST